MRNTKLFVHRINLRQYNCPGSILTPEVVCNALTKYLTKSYGLNVVSDLTAGYGEENYVDQLYREFDRSSPFGGSNVTALIRSNSMDESPVYLRLAPGSQVILESISKDKLCD